MSLHYFFFFFNDTATTEIYTLSLHDALPISKTSGPSPTSRLPRYFQRTFLNLWSRASSRLIVPAWTSASASEDRKSTRLNSSHANISYAVFCLKKKKKVTKVNNSNLKHWSAY